MEPLEIPVIHCYRCNHDWVPRKVPVKACPLCRSKLYATPRRPTLAKTERTYRQLEKQGPFDWGKLGNPGARFDVRRRRAKDALLAALGLRVSVTDGSRRV